MITPEWTVKRVEVIEPYKLKLWFADRSIKMYDFRPLLDWECFSPLRAPELFRTARIYAGSVVWSDEIDIAPEELYENGIPCE